MQGFANQARRCIKPKEKYDWTACVISLNEPSFCIWDTFMDLLLANLLQEVCYRLYFCTSLNHAAYAPSAFQDSLHITANGFWHLAPKFVTTRKTFRKSHREMRSSLDERTNGKRCMRSDASIKEVPASLHIIKCFIKSTQRRGGNDECILLFSKLSNVTLLLIHL